MKKTRVVVVGGGPAGVNAAWALSRTPELQRRFEVTLVQPGWRLGGKGATGRRRSQGCRIEEHGLHLWMGFYQHAFTMAADCYRSWDPPNDHPLATIEQAFSPHHAVTLSDREGRPHVLRLPPRPGRPWHERGDDDQRPFLHDLARWLRHELPSFVTDWSAPGSRQLAKDLWQLLTVAARGMARDGGLRSTALDEIDLAEWLRHHGATSPDVHDGAMIRAFYNLAFAYPGGRSGHGQGEVAAGPALRSLLRMLFDYRGAPFYKMRAGMGDTVFVPAWRALRARGVRMALFHRVDRLRTDGYGVTGLDVAIQAELDEPDRYDPLDQVEGRWVWPERPRREGIRRMATGDLEASRARAGRGHLREERWERGEQFEAVVLAVPVPAHPSIARDLMEANPRYRAMVDHHASVATMAAQLWLTRSAVDLGALSPTAVQTNGRGLFASWADMTETVEAEAWPTAPPLSAYFVDVAPDSWFEGLDRREACLEVARRAPAWADRELLSLFPGARGDDGRFDRRLLAREGDQSAGDPIASQYFRANVDDWERYVLTPPGSPKYRLPPEDSGFSNLVLAGDWTRSSIDGGSVEAAAESGQRAATALCDRFA